jgi:transposase
VILEALTERETLQKIANNNEISPSQITRWTDEFKKKGTDVFNKTTKDSKKIDLLEKEQKRLYEVIGEKTMEADWLKKKLDNLGEL